VKPRSTAKCPVYFDALKEMCKAFKKGGLQIKLLLSVEKATYPKIHPLKIFAFSASK